MKRMIATLLPLVLAGCGESWKPHAPVAYSHWSNPPITVEVPGTGPPISLGALVQAEVEVLERGAFAAKTITEPLRRKKTVWLWTSAEPPHTGNRSDDARFAIVGQPVGSTLVVDGMSRKPGERPKTNGGDWVYVEPFGGHALYVYDSVYRVRILRACPAQSWKGRGKRHDVGFESGCRGDFIPTSCSPSVWRSSAYARYKVAARCGQEELTFVSGPLRDDAR